MTQVPFAFFDFDGTLCAGDSIMPYILYAVRYGMAPKRQLLSAFGGFLKQKANRSRVVEAKEISLRFMQGRTVDEMDDFARRFFHDRLEPHLFAEGLAELEQLRAQGVRIVLVSASPTIYMRVLTEFLPIDDVIATPCLTDDAGRYTGRIACNCRGEEKPRLIAEWLQAHDLVIDRAASGAYGDSASDSPMMKLIAKPVLVNPKRGLRKLMPGARVVHWR